MIARGSDVIVLPTEVLAQSIGGVYLPDTAQKPTYTGCAISAGPQSRIKEGETIVYSKYDLGRVWDEANHRQLSVVRGRNVYARLV